jgi:hypothetical protein
LEKTGVFFELIQVCLKKKNDYNKLRQNIENPMRWRMQVVIAVILLISLKRLLLIKESHCNRGDQ